jgi:phospholipid/cholesterol/gamma-HCH transport system substrate-binding protein
MTVRANPTVIGAFVLGACVLIVAGLVLWGGTAMFKSKYHVVMYFDSAVTGLQKGAPVMLRGVRVGEVTDVNMRWGNWLATVYADFEPDSLKGVRPRDLDDALTRVVQERHLRAQLRMQSFVTGVLYIALDDFPGTPIVLRGLDKNVREVPTVPTDIEKWAAKLEKIADALASLPLDELARSLIATVDEAKRILKSPEIASSLKSLDAILKDGRGLVRRVDTLAANVNAQVGPLSDDAQATLKSAQATLAEAPALVADVRRVVTKIDAQIEPLLVSLKKTSDTFGVTLERAQGTLAGVDGTLNQDSALGYELMRSLHELRETLRALGSLADYLERNPNALIYGARRPAVNGVR